MKKKSILRVTALIAVLLMLCACQKAVPAGGEAENTSESTTADTREPVARRQAATTSPMPIKMSLLPLRRLI